MVFISHVTFYGDKQDEGLKKQALILQADGFSAAAEQLEEYYGDALVKCDFELLNEFGFVFLTDDAEAQIINLKENFD